MAPTKRKRATKHRGNAAGIIEARGRTGRKPTADEQRKADRAQMRQNRLDTPPTWNSAFMRAGIAAAMLLVIMLVGLGPETGYAQAVIICIFAMLIYVPLGYWTDLALYKRRMRKKAQAQREAKAS
jgi:hypothetical protein